MFDTWARARSLFCRASIILRSAGDMICGRKALQTCRVGKDVDERKTDAENGRFLFNFNGV